MPEGPEVRLNADFLNNAVFDMTFVKAEINSGRFLKQLPKNWNLFSTEFFFLELAQFTNIQAKGKLIYGEIYIANRKFYFTSTLGMSGFWTNQDLKHNHITFTAMNGVKLSFNDARRFGTFNLHLDRKEIDKKLDALGIDFFENVQDQVLSDKIQTRLAKSQEKQICEVLLDQSIFCGVGNYIKSEALHKSKIHPATQLKALNEFNLYHLIFTCERIIHESYAMGGASFKTFKDSDGKLSGQYQKEFQVYGQKETAIGQKIFKETFNDGRTSFFTFDSILY